MGWLGNALWRVVESWGEALPSLTKYSLDSNCPSPTAMVLAYLYLNLARPGYPNVCEYSCVALLAVCGRIIFGWTADVLTENNSTSAGVFASQDVRISSELRGTFFRVCTMVLLKLI